MNLRTRLPSVGRFDLFEHVRTHEVTVWDDDRIVGVAFPEVTAEPEGAWYGRLRGEDAVRQLTKQAALEYVTWQATTPDERGTARRTK